MDSCHPVAVLSAFGPDAQREARLERIATGHLSRLHGLREYRFGRHRLDIDLAGVEHIERALVQRCGAILWVAPFTFASLITKMALFRHGLRISHLSRPTHGFAASPFAIRFLNPIWTRIEERYLRERIVMEPGAETTALRAVRRRLEENGVVSIAVGDEGVQTVTVPLLGGSLRVATGPVTLAASTGAALLPVFTIAHPDCRFAVNVGAPLALDASGEREDRIEAVAAEYGARLEEYVERFPGQWLPPTCTHRS